MHSLSQISRYEWPVYEMNISVFFKKKKVGCGFFSQEKVDLVVIKVFTSIKLMN